MTRADALATSARLAKRPWLLLTSASNLLLSSASEAYSEPTEIPDAIVSSPGQADGRRSLRALPRTLPASAPSARPRSPR